LSKPFVRISTDRRPARLRRSSCARPEILDDIVYLTAKLDAIF